MQTREYAVYRPGFPSTCFGEFLGIVKAADRHEAARLGRAQFGGEVVAFWHRHAERRATRPKREQSVYRRMTADEIQMAQALLRCSFPIASWSKRFARQVGAQAAAQEPKITQRQADAMYRLMHTYRRQLPSALVELAALLERATQEVACVES